MSSHRLPSYLATADDRCEAACLATQPRGLEAASGNALVEYLLHMAADPDCEHCRSYPRLDAEQVYQVMARIVEAARR